jgi:glycosyltransferase involved in cell wall biosynthesis
MAPWAQWHEVGWAAACDGVFVGTLHHKFDFTTKRLRRALELAESIHVTGNPFDSTEVQRLAGTLRPVAERERIVIFPHRWDIEKRPGVFLDLMEKLWARRRDFRVWVTTSRPEFRSNRPELLERLRETTLPIEVHVGLTKVRYYQLLGQARVFVSTTVAENFGYCLLEAMTLGVCPVVPNQFSHPELLRGRQECLYDTKAEALERIDRALDEPQSVPNSFYRWYDESIDRMVEIMRRGGWNL